MAWVLCFAALILGLTDAAMSCQTGGCGPPILKDVGP